MASLRIIDLKERDVRLFMREELVDRTGRSLVLPETRALAAIEMRDVLEGIELRAKGLIGYLPLTSSTVLNVIPKFPVENLWGMLDVADEEYKRVLPVLRSYQHSGGIAPHQLLVRGFCHYLRDISSNGTYRDYRQEPHHGYFRPKVDFGHTLTKYLSRGDLINVASNSFTFSARLPLNAVLKSACLDFLRVTPRGDKWESERHLIADALNALSSVKAGKMHPGDESLAVSAPFWTRDAYRGALTIYAVFLGFTRIGFPYSAQGSEMPSFLFSLDNIFESFVRNVLRNGLREQRISVVDGNKPNHQQPLFRDNARFPIKPDAIIKLGKKTLALGEIKYKPKIEEADRYQVISHVIASGAPLGVWISPALSDAASGMEYVGEIATHAKFYHYRLNISSDLEAAKKELIASISRLCVPSNQPMA
jgi:5-methylcytosine-specific restriction endonuclease McrBC regulatory subunit McrC